MHICFILNQQSIKKNEKIYIFSADKIKKYELSFIGPTKYGNTFQWGNNC